MKNGIFGNDENIAEVTKKLQKNVNFSNDTTPGAKGKSPLGITTDSRPSSDDNQKGAGQKSFKIGGPMSDNRTSKGRSSSFGK